MESLDGDTQTAHAGSAGLHGPSARQEDEHIPFGLVQGALDPSLHPLGQVVKGGDGGGSHPFRADRVEAPWRMQVHGVRLLGEPTSSRNASEGQRWVYFLSPWGMQLELVSYPEGKAYERDASVRLWDPRRPAE